MFDFILNMCYNLITKGKVKYKMKKFVVVTYRQYRFDGIKDLLKIFHTLEEALTFIKDLEKKVADGLEEFDGKYINNCDFVVVEVLM